MSRFDRFLDTSTARVLAYLLIVAIAVVGFYSLDQENRRDRAESRKQDRISAEQRYALCLGLRDARDSTRENVIEIARLGRVLARGNPVSIREFDRFERERLARLDRIECPPSLEEMIRESHDVSPTP